MPSLSTGTDARDPIGSKPTRSFGGQENRLSQITILAGEDGELNRVPRPSTISPPRRRRKHSKNTRQVRACGSMLGTGACRPSAPPRVRSINRIPIAQPAGFRLLLQAAVLSVGDEGSPFRLGALCGRFSHRDVRHVWSGAAPCQCYSPGGVEMTSPRMDLDDLATAGTAPARTPGDVERLADGVEVPGGAG